MIRNTPGADFNGRRITCRCNTLLRSSMNEVGGLVGTERPMNVANWEQQIRSICCYRAPMASTRSAYGAVPLRRLELRRFASRQRSDQTSTKNVFAAPRRQRSQPCEVPPVRQQVCIVGCGMPIIFYGLRPGEETRKGDPPGVGRCDQRMESTRHQGDSRQGLRREVREDVGEDLCR